MPEHIERALGRIEAKLDNALGTTKTHEKRIASLEHDRTRLFTITAVVSTIVSAGAALASALLGKA